MDDFIPVTPDVIRYIIRYGGNCRDCADHDSICPTSGLPCGDSAKAITHVLNAINYGTRHGYLKIEREESYEVARRLSNVFGAFVRGMGERHGWTEEQVATAMKLME